MKKKLILHIGTEKTGTSSLQKYISENAVELLNHGILYPNPLSGINHYKLALACYEHYRDDDLSKLEKIDSQNDWELFRDDFFQELKSHIHANKCHTVLISSEHLHARVLSKSEKNRLKSYLTNCGFDNIKIVVYLRDQVSLANSLYSTAVCYGFCEKDIPGPNDPHIKCLCDHRKTIEDWGKEFGAENLVVRLYDADRSASFSTVADFMKLFPFLNASLFKQVEESNISISSLGLQIIRRINEIEPRFKNGVINPARRGIEHVVCKKYPGPKYQMPPNLALEYAKAFADSNEWVRKNWFPERSCLFASAKMPHQNAISTSKKNNPYNVEVEALRVLKKLQRKCLRRIIKKTIYEHVKKLYSNQTPNPNVVDKS